MTNPYEFTATEAIELIKNRKLSIYEWVSSCFDRIKQKDSEVKAWIYLDEKNALKKAIQLDDLNDNSLLGIPFGIKDIIDASNEEHVYAVKLYPAGATTNSDSGVTNLVNTYPALDQMQKEGIPLLVHGEVTHPDIDIFDREAVFIETILNPLTHKFPELKIVLEHITTKDSVDFVAQSSSKIGATITAHHLLANRNHMLVGGIKPHYYCLPILKRKTPHQDSLIEAATSGNPKFFLGTDSAPHFQFEKEAACGCAGVFSAHAAIELYAEAFEKANKLERLEGFASHFGADFYGLKRNTETIMLEKNPWMVPKSYDFSDSKVIPFFAGEELSWKLTATRD